MTLPEKIQEYFHVSGSNQRQFSRDIDVPYMTIVQVMNGVTDVTFMRLVTLKKIADFFHASIDDMIDDSLNLDDCWNKKL